MSLRWSASLEAKVRAAAGHWCKTLGISGADAEDVGQEAVLKAWRMAQSGSLVCEHGVWMVARRAGLNMLRERERRESLKPVCCGVVVMDSVLSAVLLEEVGRCYPELVAICEARADGMDWDAIGEALGVSAASAKMRWHRLANRAASDFGEMVPGLLRTAKKSGLS